MGRYIDTDLFIEDLIDYKIGRRSLDEMIKCLRSQPTADVAPVVHGHWIDNGDYVTTAYGSLSVCECSNCHTDVTLGEHDDFCPGCGAKMNGKDRAK